MTAKRAASVLLVEDDAVVRDLIFHILKSEGLEVLQACDGLDALQVARGVKNIDMLFTDLRMPRMDGEDLCVALKREFPGLKVIIFTGTPVETIEQRCHPDCVLAKPLTAGVIRQKIREVLAV